MFYRIILFIKTFPGNLHTKVYVYYSLYIAYYAFCAIIASLIRDPPPEVSVIVPPGCPQLYARLSCGRNFYMTSGLVYDTISRPEPPETGSLIPRLFAHLNDLL